VTPSADDAGLADVEHRQRLQALHRRFLDVAEVGVVARGLVLLVVEVLDRLVVEQRIHRARVGSPTALDEAETAKAHRG